jgi:hypothetical protein
MSLLFRSLNATQAAQRALEGTAPRKKPLTSRQIFIRLGVVGGILLTLSFSCFLWASWSRLSAKISEAWPKKTPENFNLSTFDPTQFAPENSTRFESVRLSEIQATTAGRSYLEYNLSIKSCLLGLSPSAIESVTSYTSWEGTIFIVTLHNRTSPEQVPGAVDGNPIQVGPYMVRVLPDGANCWISDERFVTSKNPELLKKVLSRNRVPDLPAALQEAIALTDQSKQWVLATSAGDVAPESRSIVSPFLGLFGLSMDGGRPPRVGFINFDQMMKWRESINCLTPANAAAEKSRFDDKILAMKAIVEAQQTTKPMMRLIDRINVSVEGSQLVIEAMYDLNILNGMR